MTLPLDRPTPPAFEEVDWDGKPWFVARCHRRAADAPDGRLRPPGARRRAGPGRPAPPMSAERITDALDRPPCPVCGIAIRRCGCGEPRFAALVSVADLAPGAPEREWDSMPGPEGADVVVAILDPTPYASEDHPVDELVKYAGRYWLRHVCPRGPR